MSEGLDASAAQRGLGLVTGHGHDPFWPNDIGQDSIALSRALGHAQVTGSYLAALARRRQAKLAAFDRGLARDAPDVVTLIPVT